MTVRVNDPQVQQLIADANRGYEDIPDRPSVIDPTDTVFHLAAGYMQDDGKWTTEFEVRELTGRDEEALARISDFGRVIVAMMERALVRVGNDAGSGQRLNSLIGGDWDTLLLAIRTVTFGPEIELKPTCTECRVEYAATINIQTDLAVRTAKPEDLAWTVKGKRHTYEMSLYRGDTQRKIYDMVADDKSIASINTEILHDSLTQIDGMPVLGRDEIRDLPIADRRVLLESINEHRAGPDLAGVKIKCPVCGHEQGNPLNAAALFQWN
jgi:hypothetical protein